MSYHIEDEPRPGPLGHLVVDPVWPLFGVMFGGAVLAWPWFVWNGFAVGSPTRFREAAVAAAGFAGTILLLVVLGVLASNEAISGLGVRYALIGVTVWKLGVSYWLHVIQSRSFHLYEHFGGTVKSGLGIVFVGALLVPRALAGLPDFWTLVLR